MKNLDTVLSTKTLVDLENSSTQYVPTRLVPTKIEIGKILKAMKDGLDDTAIRKTIRRAVNGADRGFTKGQIALIREKRKGKIKELTPVAEVVI